MRESQSGQLKVPLRNRVIYSAKELISASADDTLDFSIATSMLAQERQRYAQLEASINRAMPRLQSSPDSRLELRALQQRTQDLSEECAEQTRHIKKLKVPLNLDIAWFI